MNYTHLNIFEVLTLKPTKKSWVNSEGHSIPASLMKNDLRLQFSLHQPTPIGAANYTT
jgi:hypothetical protein